MNRMLKISQILEWLEREPVGAALVSLVGDSAVYLLGGLLLGLGNIILIPVYTRALAPREFGMYALVDIAVMMVVTVSALKMDVSYLKWFADLDAERRGELLGAMLLTGVAVSLCGGGALSSIFASHYGALWLNGPTRTFAWMLLPIVVLENSQVLLLSNLRAHRRAVSYSAVAIIRLIGIVVATYYLLIMRRLGLPGLFLGRMAGDAIAIAVLLAISLRKFVFKASFDLIRPMLRFGLPLVWCMFAIQLQDASGRYFLSRHGALDQVGLLGAAIKIGSVFQTLISVPFGVAWGGVLFQIVKERDAKMIYSKIFGYVCVVALGVALVLTVFAPTLFKIFATPAYYPAIAVFPFVILVRALNTIEQPAGTGIYLSGSTGTFAIAYTTAVLLNLTLMSQLVPKYGLIGVGWAWLIGAASVPLMMFIFGQRVYPLRLSKMLLLLPLLLWASLVFRSTTWTWNLPSSRLWFQSVVGAVIATLVAGVLAWDFRQMRRQRIRELNEWAPQERAES